MTDASTGSSGQGFVQHVIETVIRVGVVIALALWCIDIVQPFIGVVVWGVIIAIAVGPLYGRLQSSLGGRRGLAAAVVTLLMLLVLITPTVALV